MRLHVIAVGQRLPDWAQTAWDDYARRFPPELRVQLHALKAEPRTLGKPVAALLEAERGRIQAAIPRGAHVVALDERGLSLRTLALARELALWQSAGADVALLIGGPDGLCPTLREAAAQRLRLSDLTLPHALARVVLIEALYRAWSINAHHPYHRE